VANWELHIVLSPYHFHLPWFSFLPKVRSEQLPHDHPVRNYIFAVRFTCGQVLFPQAAVLLRRYRFQANKTRTVIGLGSRPISMSW
jgi:hypothetical protein